MEEEDDVDGDDASLQSFFRPFLLPAANSSSSFSSSSSSCGDASSLEGEREGEIEEEGSGLTISRITHTARFFARK